MGEVVDLEKYRRRVKRRAARSPGAGNRRTPDQPVPHGTKSGPEGDARFGEKGKAGPGNVGPGKRGPAGNAKIEPSDPDTE